MNPLPVRKFVLAPDLIGGALIDPGARGVLESWRDGRLVALMNRELISLHLRILNQLGLPPYLLKRWAYWFASPDKTIFVEKQFLAEISAADVCERLVQAGSAEAIICWRPRPTKAQPLWIIAKDCRAIGL